MDEVDVDTDDLIFLFVVRVSGWMDARYLGHGHQHARACSRDSQSANTCILGVTYSPRLSLWTMENPQYRWKEHRCTAASREPCSDRTCLRPSNDRTLRNGETHDKTRSVDRRRNQQNCPKTSGRNTRRPEIANVTVILPLLSPQR